jgi:Amt family ammonium transporter
MENRRRGVPEHYERRYRHKNGQAVWTLASAVPILDAGQNFKGTFGMFIGITERKRAEEALRLQKDEAERANRGKSEFLSKMSHELRTPLNSIMGFSELLKTKVPGDLNKKQEDYIETIHISGHRLLGIVNDMLDLVKIESGEKFPLSIELFRVSAAIDEALVFVNEKAAQKNITIIKEIDPGLETITADKLRFKQILLYLLDNAIKFSKPEGGTITMIAGKKDGMAQFSVTDTGIGIKEEDMSRLFDLFRQIDSGTSRKYGGTGSELAITRQLVEQHGGKIWVKSNYGEGSIFTFTLPL